MEQEKSETISVVCRVCLRSDTKIRKKCLYLFEEYNDCLISEKINSIANIDIRQGDGLPDMICPDCLLELESAVRFKLKCESSNIILQSNGLSNIDRKLVIKEEIDPPTEYIDTGCFDNDLADVKPHVDDSIEIDIKGHAIGLKFECHDCGNLFKSKCKLRVHWKKTHKCSQLICERCKRQFKSYKAFHVHLKSNLSSCVTAGRSLVRIEGVGKARVFHCKECTYHTTQIKNIQSHLVLHTGDRPFVCKMCPKTFTQLSALQAHRESIHKEYRAEGTCHLCGKHIKGRNKLYKHLKLHNSPRVQCDVCKKIFKNSVYLQTHMKRHSNTKAYSCEICGSMFFTSSDLSNHRRTTHNKEKKFACNICGYLARRAEIIKRHKLKHTATNVACLVCGKFSANKEELIIHQKRHFERHHKCPHCESMFYKKRDLCKHISKKHRCTMLVKKPSKPVCVKQEIPSNTQYEEVVSLSPTIIGN